MNSLVMKQQLKAWAGAHAEEYLKIADDIWNHPELSMQEFHCSGLIKDKLRAEGFTVEEGTGGMPTAFLATYSYGTGKPVIGINCEYDSLPGLSQSCCSTSKNPITEGAPGQGCGHNLLGTAALKTAVALRYLLEEETISGTIKGIPGPVTGLIMTAVWHISTSNSILKVRPVMEIRRGTAEARLMRR